MIWVTLTQVALLAGCDSVTVEPLPVSGTTLCYADYKTCVDPVFHAVINGASGATTCSASGCHDINVGSGGGFKLFPNAADDARLLTNFNTARAFANLNSPQDSKLLLEPLSGISAISGTHTGGDIFPDSGDACYQTILKWISNPVEDIDAASCGLCTPPDLAQCGF